MPKEELENKLAEAKDIIERLLANRPDTYSGTYVELNQSKMFEFNRAVSDADDFLEELAEAEKMLQEEQERDLLYEELMMQNYDFEYGDVEY